MPGCAVDSSVMIDRENVADPDDFDGNIDGGKSPRGASDKIVNDFVGDGVARVLEYSCSPVVEVIPSVDPVLSISSGSCTQDVPSPQVVVSSQEVPSSQDLELSSTVTKTVDKFYFDVTRLRVNRKKWLVQIFMFLE